MLSVDGKPMLVTNVTDLIPQEVVQRYEVLADIERVFRVKSEIEIAPVYRRLRERIRAHAFVCFLALIVCRVMRQRLKLAKIDLSPESALAELRTIQRHKVRRRDEGSEDHQKRDGQRDFQKIPTSEEEVWSGEFWTDGYFASTMGKHGDGGLIGKYEKNQGDKYR